MLCFWLCRWSAHRCRRSPEDGKVKDVESPPGVSRKECSLADTLTLAQWAQHQSSDWENCEIINGHCFKSLCVWYLVIAAIGTSSTKCTWAMETLRNGTKTLVKILCITDNRKPIRTNNTKNVLAGITKKARLNPMPETHQNVITQWLSLSHVLHPTLLQTRGKSESSGSPSGHQVLLDRREKEQILRRPQVSVTSRVSFHFFLPIRWKAGSAPDQHQIHEDKAGKKWLMLKQTSSRWLIVFFFFYYLLLPSLQLK